MRLTHKAAARLRKINYWTGAVGVDVSLQVPEASDLPAPAAPPGSSPPALPDEGFDVAWNWGSTMRTTSRRRGAGGSSATGAARWRLPLCQDTPNILRLAADLWRQRPPGTPFKVGMVLLELRPARSATPSLFEDDRRAADVSHAIDEVNREFGASVIHYGSMYGMKDAAPTRISYTQIPDFDRRVN